MACKDGYIMEHRLLMAGKVGRLLTRTEVVHHLDHNPLNNALTNLEPGRRTACTGQRKVVRFVEGAANRRFLEV